MKKKSGILIGAGLLTAIIGYAYITHKKNKGAKGLDSVSKKILARFSSNNKKLFDSLNPAVKTRFNNFIKDITNKGYAVILTSAYRSTANQKKQKEANPKNATPGFSTHEYGIGVDINLVKDGKWINKDSSNSDWIRTGIVDLAKKKYNFRWGGEFPKYHDPVHFDDGNRFKTPSLYAQALKQFGSPDKIRGNELKLV